MLKSPSLPERGWGEAYYPFGEGWDGYMRKNLLLLFFLFPATLFAQVSITGKVVSLFTKKAVPDASAYLSNASVGGKTADDGTFTLNNVKNGQYDMVVSCIGFETYHHTILVNSEHITLPDIELVPKAVALKEVKVRPDFNREKYVQMFKNEFFGRTENAKDCKLLNPDLLDLDYDKATTILSASSPDFLIIENAALGYRIKYKLQTFVLNPRAGTVAYTGSSVFEPMKGSNSQEKRWQKKRIAAYRGSDMHFLRACIANDVPEEGFLVYQLIRKPNADRPADSLISAKLKFFNNSSGFTSGFRDSVQYWQAKARLPKFFEEVKGTLNSVDYIKLTQKKGIYGFGYTDCLRITFTKQETVSIITFIKPFAFFDSNGIIINPDSNTLEGYWGNLRIADLLPVDYELPTTF